MRHPVMANNSLSMDPSETRPDPSSGSPAASGEFEQKSEGYKVRGWPPTPSLPEQQPRTFRVSLVVSWSLWVAYTIFEAVLIRRVEKRNGTFIWRLWAIAFAEMAFALPQFFFSMNTLYASIQPATHGDRPEYELQEDAAPSIDVLLPTCGEALDIVMDTLLGVSFCSFPAS